MLYETVRRADRRRGRARRAADYVTFTSASTVRYFLDGAGGSAARPRSSRSARRRPRRCARRGCEPHVEADAAHARRPGRGARRRRARADAPGHAAHRLRDADEFVGVLHAVIARIAPGAQVIDLAHGIRRQDVVARRAGAGATLPYAPAGVHLAVVDPGVGGRAARGRAAHGRGGPAAGRARQRAAPAGGRRASAASRRPSRSPLALAARAGVGHVPRPRPVRAGRGPARGGRAARRGRRRRSTPPTWSRLELPAPRRSARPSIAPSPASTASATSRSTPPRPTSPPRSCGGRRGARAAGRAGRAGDRVRRPWRGTCDVRRRRRRARRSCYEDASGAVAVALNARRRRGGSRRAPPATRVRARARRERARPPAAAPARRPGRPTTVRASSRPPARRTARS